MPRLKDTAFLYVTALVREKENKLISAAQLDRMIRGESVEDAAKILEECGYGSVDVSDAVALDRALRLKFAEILKEIAKAGPDSRIADTFRIKYDYHNAKVFLKAEAVKIDAQNLLSDGGRVPREVWGAGFPSGVPADLLNAVTQAREILIETKDAQTADILLDRAMYREYLALAEYLEDEFFAGYIRISIDIVNLRTAVRAARMGLGAQALTDALIPGGNFAPERVSGDIKTLYINTPLETAAVLAKIAMDGGNLTAFERAADNALLTYLKKARFIAFGIAPVLRYISALETEAVAVRTVMASRGAGLSPEEIRERLRDLDG